MKLYVHHNAAEPAKAFVILLMETKEYRMDFICFLNTQSSQSHFKRISVSYIFCGSCYTEVVNPLEVWQSSQNLTMTLTNQKFVHNEIGSKLN
jgi:hypothetical protein